MADLGVLPSRVFALVVVFGSVAVFAWLMAGGGADVYYSLRHRLRGRRD